jgi:hypothetical protein
VCDWGNHSGSWSMTKTSEQTLDLQVQKMGTPFNSP